MLGHPRSVTVQHSNGYPIEMHGQSSKVAAAAAEEMRRLHWFHQKIVVL
jgi:hypothetical protein